MKKDDGERSSSSKPSDETFKKKSKALSCRTDIEENSKSAVQRCQSLFYLYDFLKSFNMTVEWCRDQLCNSLQILSCRLLTEEFRKSSG